MVERTCIQTNIKENLVQPLMDKVKAECLRRLASTPAERQTLEQQIGAVFEVHRGIETTEREEGALRRAIQPVPHTKRELIDRPDENGAATGSRRGDFVYDVPIDKELSAMLAADPSLLAQLQQASDSWAQEQPQPGETRTVFADLTDGARFKAHPGLGTDADRSDGSLRLAFILYYDDLEVVNPLGAFHGRHKLGMFYWALVNIEQETRMAFHNLHLMTVALVSDIDYYGIQQVVSGLPGDSSFGSAMTNLDAGINLTLPDGSKQLVRGWCVCLSADYPAAALCSGFKKSVSANVFCRECYVDQTSAEYPSPTSFLADNDDLQCDLCLRSQEELDCDYAHFQTLNAGERAAYLSKIGMNSFNDHAFVRVPHFDICQDIPYDFMHVELEGSLKNELAAMLFYFLRKRPTWGFTIEKLNARMRNYAWPGGFAPPTFTVGYLEKGTTEGKCKKGCHVHMTAGDMAIFVRHSIDLLLPLIGDVSDPLWQCWVAHVKYVRLLLQHRLTYDELLELDRCIYEHHQLFLACDEYGERLFKPKNHFACHFPADILNHGPVRHYWAMRFEALNQLFKKFAATGAFRNTCGRCAGRWTIRAALERDRRTKASWGKTEVQRSRPLTTYRRGVKPTGLAKGGVGALVIDALFDKLSAQKLEIAWVSHAYYMGAELEAGYSWLSATFDGTEEVLAFIPEEGIFRSRNNKVWALLRIYPVAKRDEFGLPVSTVPAGYQPEERLVLLDTKKTKLSNVAVLWLSHKMAHGSTTMYRFVPL